MDTDRATADLDAVEHQVVGAREHLAGGGVEQLLVGQARRGERVVRRRDLARLVVDLEQRRIGQPHELVLAAADEPEQIADVQADRAHAGVGDLGLVGDEQEQVARAGTGELVQAHARLVGHALGRRAGPAAAVADAHEGHALGAVRLGEVGELVELRAAEAIAVGHAQALDDAALGDGVVEHAEPGVDAARRQITQREVEPQVGLVDAVLVHRLGVGHAAQRQRDLEAEDVLPQRRDHALDRGLQDLLGHERHLDVDLRELGLAIEAEILVAEAAHDLEVAVVARDHQQLLEDLRRLGERVELAGVEPRRHEEVPRAARRVLHHERRLDLEEPVGPEVVADGAGDLRARDQVLLQLGPAQIEVAVLEPQRLVGLELVLDGEGRRVGLREHLEIRGPHLDGAGRQVGVLVAAARLHLAGDADAVLGAQVGGEREQRRGRLRRIEHQLREALAIAKIDEHAAAVIAIARDPAGQGDLRSDIGVAELAAGVAATVTLEERGHGARTIARAESGISRRPTKLDPRGTACRSPMCDQIVHRDQIPLSGMIAGACDGDPIPGAVDNLIPRNRDC